MVGDSLKGYVEIWDSVRRCDISPCSNPQCLSIYIDDDGYDGSTSKEFIEDLEDKFYLSLEDYKKGRFISITEWLKTKGIKLSELEF